MTTNVLVFAPHGETTLVLDRRRRIHNVLARLRAWRLDAQLAGGRTPESGRLLAVRAAMLTAPDSRERLAGYWEGVIASAVTRHGALEARVCVATRQVKGAEDDIRRLVEALRAPRPVAARGAALASELLRDGGGPVYNPMSPRSLVREVQVARNRLSAAISDD